MSNVLEYKGYHTNIEIDFEANEFYGELEGISDFVNFMSSANEGVAGIIREFHSAVDDYIDFCREVGKTPAVDCLPEARRCLKAEGEYAQTISPAMA